MKKPTSFAAAEIRTSQMRFRLIPEGGISSREMTPLPEMKGERLKWIKSSPILTNGKRGKKPQTEFNL
jgi:hypothetical protein